MKRVLACLFLLPLYAEWTFVGTSEWEKIEVDGREVLHLHRAMFRDIMLDDPS